MVNLKPCERLKNMPASKAIPKIEDFGLGPQLATREIPHNPWLAMLEWDATQVLPAISSDPISFSFTQSRELQAGANTEHRLILVSGGLGDLMCRLCAAIVGAGVFIKLGNPPVNCVPDYGESKSAKALLDRDFFRWDDEYAPWRKDSERQQLFAFLLIQTHRFVLLHEAGHILHGHGWRSERTSLGSVIDGPVPPEADEAAAISSMARELVADAQAFHFHFRLLEEHFAREGMDEMTELLREKLVGSPRERLRMTLLAAFLVFQLLDYREWSFESARLRSHPPAPFRMKALYATALELNHSDMPSEVLKEEVEYASLLGSVVVDVGLNRLPQIKWINQVDGPEFDRLFARIHAQMHKWADPSLF